MKPNTFYFLLLLGIILGVYSWYTFAIIYHLIRFGVGTKPKRMALIFFIGSFVLFSITIIAYLKIDWQNIIRVR